MLAPGDERAAAEHEALWPLKRIPVLVDEGRTVLEASIIIEHLDLRHPGPVRLIPEDPHAALDVRMMDRFFDNYIMTPMQKIVARPYRPLFPLGAPDRD
jgi:glutathione S-transferase